LSPKERETVNVLFETCTKAGSEKLEEISIIGFAPVDENTVNFKIDGFLKGKNPKKQVEALCSIKILDDGEVEARITGEY
jgi:hypothetical protein